MFSELGGGLCLSKSHTGVYYIVRTLGHGAATGVCQWKILEAFKVPIPWTVTLLKPSLAHFQHISALIAASVLLSCRERGLDSWKSRPRSSDARMLGISGSGGGGSWSTSSGREQSLSGAAVSQSPGCRVAGEPEAQPWQGAATLPFQGHTRCDTPPYQAPLRTMCVGRRLAEKAPVLP